MTDYHFNMKDLIREVCKDNNLTQSELGYRLGFKTTSGFFTSITNETIDIKKRERLCREYGYQMNFHPRKGWTYKKVK